MLGKSGKEGDSQRKVVAATNSSGVNSATTCQRGFLRWRAYLQEVLR